jgi:hypothetical protein
MENQEFSDYTEEVIKDNLRTGMDVAAALVPGAAVDTAKEMAGRALGEVILAIFSRR